MTDKTLTQLITIVQQELYQVAGPGLQAYSETTITNKIQRAFDMLFTDHFWKRFITYNTFTLNGTNGECNETVSNTFREFSDIQRIYPLQYTQPLRKFTAEVNPALIYGTQPLYYMNSNTAGKVFTVVPPLSVGSVIAVGRQYPNTTGTFAGGDTVPFDYHVIVMLAAWSYAVDDASNPGMADKFQKLFESRLKQLKAADSNDPIDLTGDRLGIPVRWSE